MSRRLLTLIFALSIFLSAFLLFSVQPLISKLILPNFGGAPAVWTVCMLFFQITLLLGYAAAHAVECIRSRRLATFSYVGLLLLSAFLLQISNETTWDLKGEADPTWTILSFLIANIGLAFFLLSTASPLLQSWVARTRVSDNPYRLYALSNVGSLLALLSYPLLIEPLVPLTAQVQRWSVFYWVTSALLATSALVTLAKGSAYDRDSSDKPQVGEGFSLLKRTQVFIFAAVGSTLLLAFTNHVCHDVAVIPLLWVLPLAIYLLTFILCFESNRWYRADLYFKFGLLFFFLLGDKYIGGVDASVFTSVTISLATLFVACMICHGQIASMKPNTKHLTDFYLTLSAGGALGGFFVGYLAPRIFNAYYELFFAIIALLIYVLIKLYRDAGLFPKLQGLIRSSICVLIFGVLSIRLFVLLDKQKEDVLYQTRNFFGVLRIVEEDTADGLRVRGLRHGRIVHGAQRSDERESIATRTYYRSTSGIARALAYHSGKPRRVGVIGLGIAEILYAAAAGDYFKFYELDPEVGELARRYFTFLERTPAEVDIRYGDGRVALASEQPNKFDVFMLDAFSSDAVPAHLLTYEAMGVYLKHLADDGLLVIHISNRHMDLSGVVWALAKAHKLQGVMVLDDLAGKEERDYNNRFVVLSKDVGVFDSAAFAGAKVERLEDVTDFPKLWTDDYSEVISAIDWLPAVGRYLD